VSAPARALALAWLFVLGGCVGLEFERAADARGFELSGRIAVRYGAEAAGGQLRWRHDRDGDEMIISSPLGQGLARIELQKRGVVIMRDASANKCGVISSSYEIIANLLLSDEEFLAHKESYVADVIEILNIRAEDEARLIFHRSREVCGSQLLTEISAGISQEINQHYARLFDFFQRRLHLWSQPLYRTALLQHLPRMIREEGHFRGRIDRLPEKIRSAILASEIASSLVYHSDRDSDYAEMIEGHLKRRLPVYV